MERGWTVGTEGDGGEEEGVAGMHFPLVLLLLGACRLEYLLHSPTGKLRVREIPQTSYNPKARAHACLSPDLGSDL